MTPTSTQLLGLWRRLSPLPGGPWLFSKVFGFMVPYSGSVGPRIRVLEPGHAVVEITAGVRTGTIWAPCTRSRS